MHRLTTMAVVAGLAVFGTAVPAAAATPPPVPLPFAALPHGAHRLGAAAKGDAITVSVALRPRHQAELDALVKAVGEPGNAAYRHYLTPAQYDAAFAPTASDVTKVRSYLAAKGLAVGQVSGNRQVVEARGTAAAVTAAFGTGLSQFTAADGSAFLAPDKAPTVPADLGNVVRAVGGLTDRAMFQHAAAPGAPSGPGGGYTPAQLRTAYSMTGLTGGYTGSGETVGLIEFDTFKQADITTWTNYFGQPAVTPTVVKVDGGVSTPGSGQLEVTLDIDAVASMAPAAKQVIYSAPNTESGWIDEMAKIASDDSVNVLSGSWLAGEKCESGPISASHDSYNQLVLQGVTLLSASGDWGATGCGYNGDNSTIEADYPASDPLVTGVGGTSLTTSDTSGTYASEKCWNSGSTGSTRSGGAYSSIYTRPDYQTGTNTNQYRSVPDVSMLADYSTGALSVNTNGTWQSVGGTSLASPLWAGYVALVDQKGGTELGQLNPTLYGLGRGSTYSTLFHDVTTGNNGTYSAVTGYDLCTGWGTLKGDALAAALVAPPTSDFSLSVSPASGSVDPGAKSTATVATSGTGTISLTASGAPTGVTVAFSPASVTAGTSSTVTFTAASTAAAGTYPITITGTAAGVTHTATYTLTVTGTTTPPTDFSLSVSPASGSIAPGTKSSATATTSGSGTISLTASGAPTGVTVAFSPTSVTAGDSSTITFIAATTAAAGTYPITVTGTAGSVTHTATYTLTVTGSTTPPTGPLTLANPGTVTGDVGVATSLTLQASGGKLPYTFSASGLPAGLTLNHTTGVISGKPTTWANYYVTAKVTDASGASQTASFYWFIFLY